MKSYTPLFPTSGRVSEERQIGRRETIDRLYGRVCRGHHALLFGERRIGKSSVAAATISRVRAAGGVGIDIDCSADIGRDGAFVASLLRQAEEQGVSGETSVRRIRESLHVGADKARRLVSLGTALGIREAADVDRVLGTLVGTEQTHDVRDAVAAVLGAALVADRNVVILLDEVQHIVGWRDSEALQRQLAAAMRHSGGPSFIYSGSVRRPLEQLFAAERPLYAEGLWFDLPGIADGDWKAGLGERFGEGCVKIDASVIRQILAISDGHPEDTMRLCAHAYEWALQSPERMVDAHVLGQASLEARSHPSWGTR